MIDIDRGTTRTFEVAQVGVVTKFSGPITEKRLGE